MSSGATRAQIDRLTDTQKRVLARVAAGETNYAIATALGMTLDGAKYHVSEILAKLGVDSREEAAAAWRDTQRSPRARLARLFALPAAKWAAGGAAGVVAVAGGLWLLTSLASEDEVRDPGADQVAYIAPDGVEDPPGPPVPAHLVVLSDDGKTRRLGDPFFPLGFTPRWSADGRWIAVIEHVTEEQWAVRVFDANTGESTAFAHQSGDLEWSPDGHYLATMSLTEVTIWHPDGDLVAQMPLPPPDGTTSSGSTNLLWSPDSGRVAIAFDETLSILFVDGQATQLDRPVDFPQGRVQLLTWDGPTRLLIADPTRPPASLYPPIALYAWSADTSVLGAGWTPFRFELPGGGPTPFPTRYQDMVPGLQQAGACMVAGGDGKVQAFSAQPRSASVTLVLDIEQRLTRLDLPEAVSIMTAARGCAVGVWIPPGD